jgi:hypothetical protein
MVRGELLTVVTFRHELIENAPPGGFSENRDLASN